MKKIIRILSAAALLMILLSVSALAGHEHDYKFKMLYPATFEKDGAGIYLCDCGDELKDDTTIPAVSDVYLSATIYNYNGKEKKPSVIVSTWSGDKLKNGTDYTVKYEKGRILPGKYNVRVTLKGNYKGESVQSFIIKPSTVKNVKITPKTSSITLSWDKVTGASGYAVFMHRNGTWERIKTITSGDTLSYTVKSLESGTAYDFRIQSYKKDGGTIWSNYGSTIKASTKPAQTSKLIYTSTKTSITLNWKKVKGASSYIVYLKNGDSWKKLTETDKLTFTLNKLKTEAKYTFAVRAHKKTTRFDLIGDIKTVEAATRPHVMPQTPDAVKNLRYTPYKTKVKLTWNSVKSANLYKIYHNDGGVYKLLGTSTKPEFTVKDIYQGYIVNIAVVACIKLDDKEILTSKKTSILAHTIPVAPEKLIISRMANSLSVEWPWDEESWGICSSWGTNIDGFRIRYKKTGSSKWEKTIINDNYKVWETQIKNLKPNTSYTVSVQTYAETDSGTIFGETTEIKVKTLTGKESYYALTAGGLKLYPITSKEGKALYKKAVDNFWIITRPKDIKYYEAKTASGKTLLFFSDALLAYDTRGYQYDSYGKIRYCYYCMEIRGETPGTCHGGCNLVFS